MAFPFNYFKKLNGLDESTPYPFRTLYVSGSTDPDRR